jgi:flagellar basal body-associated protein FliL
MRKQSDIFWILLLLLPFIMIFATGAYAVWAGRNW